MKKYEVWTDGSCWYKDGIGGWAFIVVHNGEIKYEDLGFETHTTSARMEMRAVLEGMKYMNKNYPKSKVFIVSDYATVVNCFNERWWSRWIEMDWYDIANKDLWKKMLKEYFNKVTRNKFIKVKGHTGITLNERADFLAGEARKFCLDKVKNDRKSST